jgi:hypothetical protein
MSLGISLEHRKSHNFELSSLASIRGYAGLQVGTTVGEGGKQSSRRKWRPVPAVLLNVLVPLVSSLTPILSSVCLPCSDSKYHDSLELKVPA